MIGSRSMRIALRRQCLGRWCTRSVQGAGPAHGHRDVSRNACQGQNLAATTDDRYCNRSNARNMTTLWPLYQRSGKAVQNT